MKSPDFWNKRNGPLVKLLRPLGRIYGDIVQGRLQQTVPYQSTLPVICVGNVTMGGSGKTPVVHALVQMLKEAGKQPAVLLRGYGGSNKQTMAVDPSVHSAALVGDEALLHAVLAPTIVSPDRVKGAQAIEGDAWNTHIVMDDGLQNPSLKKSLSFLVVDGENPFGNGEIFPAGPLREHIDQAVRRVQAMIVIGKKNDDLITRFGFLLPIFQAHLAVVSTQSFADKPVIAFAGIGHPQKFFDTLQRQKARIVEDHAFPDHHAYAARDIQRLQDKASRAGALLVTTRKDWVRLTPAQRDKINVLDVVLQWEDPQAVMSFMQQKGML